MEDRKTIIDEILTLMNDLGHEDLLFLREQAGVLDYNRRVRLKREEQSRQTAKPENPEPEVKNSSEKPLPAKRGDSQEQTLRIEQTEKPKFFNICRGKARIFIDYSEIKALFKIASAASPGEAGPRLYRWLEKERSDVLSELHLSNGNSPVLKELHQALIDSFTSDS